jgi:maltooligosyltrehalose trehalohydrolase
MSSGLGAQLQDGERALFRVWAPFAEHLEVQFLPAGRQDSVSTIGADGSAVPARFLASPLSDSRRVKLTRDARGYHEALLDGVSAADRYVYRFPDGTTTPDPASRSQPLGIHGPSEIVDLQFQWSDQNWQPPALADLVIYELHVGTFTRSGTLDAVIDHLPELQALGVTALELMPIAQFPGLRNWGYDGVFPFAVQNSYGGPQALQRLVDACHAHGMAVFLDVVYNHLGPDGNALARFAPYFSERFRTPWGEALNFDGPGSDDVRHFFIENARQWLFDLHIDGLRLDAVHAIFDTSAYPFLSELADRIYDDARALGRRVYLFAESDRNDPRLIRPRPLGGHGLDALWSDDFHHALHTLLTGESQGYYADFGDVAQLGRAYSEAFVFGGQYSTFRDRRHGAAPGDLAAHCFVVCAQNHDQIGNRMLGERLSGLVAFEAQKLAAAITLTSPYIPLLFMGEEFGELAPFPYFVDHTDPLLVDSVRDGRKREFARFAWNGEPPDPQAESTFTSARLNRHLRERSPHRELVAYYQHLLALRRELHLQRTDRSALEVVPYHGESALLVLRPGPETASVALLLCFHPEGSGVRVPLAEGIWRVRSDSAAADWAGPGSKHPECVRSSGQVELALAPWSALLLEHMAG